MKESVLYKIIGKSIYKRRKARDWTQGQLAEALGYKSPATIAQWEKAQRYPSIADLVALAQLFGTGMDELCGLR